MTDEDLAARRNKASKETFWSSIRSSSKFIEKGRRWPWLGVALVAASIGLMEVVGSGLIYALLTVLTRPNEKVELPILGDIRDFLPGASAEQDLLWLSSVVAVFFLIRAATYVGGSYLQQRLAFNTGVRLSNRLMSGYLRMPYTFHLQHSSSELMRNTQDSVATIVSSLFIPLLAIASEGLLVAGVVIVLAIAAPMVTLAVVVIMAPIILLLAYLLQPKLAKLGQTSQEMHLRSIELLQQSFHGIREIKILGRESFFVSRFSHARAMLARTYYLRSTLMDVPRATGETIIVIMILIMIMIQIWKGQSISESIAILGLFAYSVLRILPSINRIVAQANSLRFGSSAVETVSNDLELFNMLPTHDELIERLAFERDIELVDVDIRYPGSNENALSNVNISIHKGEALGIVGTTGGGKTTLADTLLGLIPPYKGHINVDGKPIKGLEKAWQMNFGVVPQAPFLLQGTVKENIAIGIESSSVDAAQIRTAVAQAQLEETLSKLPLGLETSIGEFGTGFSGGEKQRLVIARALYRRPSILLMDEGTSALDSQTEGALVNVLRGLKTNMTMVFITHRPALFEICDRLVVIEGGRIVDTGTTQEVIDRRPELRSTPSPSQTTLE